jgi:SAM-dependent methyltransferase
MPFASVPALTDRLAGCMDIEGKIPRALEALGPLAGRAVAVLDVPGTPWVERLPKDGADPLLVPAGEPGGPLRVPAPDASLDVVVTLWTGFRGVDPSDVGEVDRVLRPGGRLLVVHDYGRDDVSTLREPDAPEYLHWSRRGGPFLGEAGFKIRVLHCFWTFASIEDAREALALFGDRGEAVLARLKRPRLSWNVAVYHRGQGGVEPDPMPDGA